MDYIMMTNIVLGSLRQAALAAAAFLLLCPAALPARPDDPQSTAPKQTAVANIPETNPPDSAPAAALGSTPSATPAEALPIQPKPAALNAHTNIAPLSLHIGAAEFTPGGFLDFTSVFRSTNVGSGIGTSFGSIPASNTAQGQLGESRFSAQNSRLSLKVNTVYGAADVTGYVEVDFLGTQPTNAYVSSNGNSLRMRLYWADVKAGKWELLGGQSWSLLTPNRNGLSPMPSDMFITFDVDTNYQVGLTWSRAPQFRVMRHWNSHWTTGFSFENPEQYVGGAVVLPSSFYSTQLDNGGVLTAPSPRPDIITKTAFDGKPFGRALHVEAAGLLRSFRVVSLSNARLNSTGGGAAVNLNFEVLHGVRLIANTFSSSGGGRYIYGLGPDLVLRPDGQPSNVRASSGILGIEHQVNSAWLWFAYYGGVYFQRNYSASPAGLIGYGYPGSSTSANRSIQEPTFGVIRTLWKSPEYGALQVITQYSYVQRNPWATAPAQSHMVFADLRYVLP